MFRCWEQPGESRAQPRRGDGEAPRRHFSFVLDLGCPGRGPGKNPGDDSLKGAHSMCSIRWWSPGTGQRAGRRRRREEEGFGTESNGHLSSASNLLAPLVLGSHFISRGGKGRNIPSPEGGRESKGGSSVPVTTDVVTDTIATAAALHRERMRVPGGNRHPGLMQQLRKNPILLT